MDTILEVTVLLDDGAVEEELIEEVCPVLVCCLSVVVSTKMGKIE